MTVLITAVSLLSLVVSIEIYGLVGQYYDFSGELLKEKITHILHPGAAALLYMLMKVRKVLGMDTGGNDRGCYRKLYVGQNYEEIKVRKQLDLIAGMLLVILVSCGTVLLLKLGGETVNSRVENISRPETGTENLKLEAVYDDTSYVIEVELDERYPTVEEMNERVQRTELILEQAILGSNQSLSEVRSNLILTESYNDTSVKIRWISSNTSLLNTDGTVKNQDIYVS